jgi:Tol biopolymer transport system component
MPLTPGRKLGTCEILAPLGAGGMGEVYRARDIILGREVAVKVLPPGFTTDPDRLRRFSQEAQAAAALNHPNVLAIYHVGDQDGAPYIVSELLEGETLRDRLRTGALAVRKAVDFAMQAASGLAAAHDKGIVHRDLKPENLFITNDGQVKILDFGLAKLTRPDSEPVGQLATVTAGTGAGLVLGTVGYMSPEQVRAQAVDARTDIFSLGAILYEMLSGKRAFEGDTPADTMSAILREEPIPLTASIASVPLPLERIVRHCLEKNPYERFQSARDLKFDLSELSSPSLVSPSGVSASLPLAPAPAKRNRTALLTTGVVLLMAVTGAAGWLAHAPTPHQPTFQRLTFRRGIVSTARFAQDKKTIVYGAAWEGAPLETFVVTADSPESRSLGVPRTTVHAVSPSNELALSLRTGRPFPPQSGTLARAPLLGGAAPRQIMDKVEYADWGPGDTLAVTLDTGLGDRLEYPIGTTLYEVPGQIHQIRVSPDGSRVAFQGLEHGKYSIALVDRNKQKTKVVDGWLEILGLAWTPDGNEIWFGGKSENSGWGIYSVTQSGTVRLLLRSPGPLRLEDVAPNGRLLVTFFSTQTGIRYLAPDASQETDLSWLDTSVVADLSPDGQWILFSEFGEAAGSEGAVYLRKTDGSPAVRLGTGGGLSLSSDGKLALTMARSRLELRVLPVGVGEPRTLTLPKNFDRYEGGQWLPDGRLLVGAIEHGSDPRLYVQKIGEGLRAVSPPGVVSGYTVSPDGQRVLASINNKPFMLAVNGGEPQPVASIEDGEMPVRWSADGQFVLVSRTRDQSRNVYRVNLKTGARVMWKTIAPADLAGVVRLSGFHITSDEKSYAYSYTRELGELYVVEGLR